MAISTAILDTDQLQQLLQKGLEKDIIDSLTKHFIALTKPIIEAEIKENVTKVVRSYVQAVTHINRDPVNERIVINIEFRGKAP